MTFQKFSLLGTQCPEKCNRLLLNFSFRLHLILILLLPMETVYHGAN